MKILYVFNSLEYSGAELMYIQAAYTLIQRGYEISVVATGEEIGACSETFKEKGFVVHHLPLVNCKSICKVARFIRAVSSIIKNQGITHLHCQSNRLFFLCAYIAHKNGIKSIYSINNMFDCKSLLFPYHKLKRVIAHKLWGMRYHSGSDTVYQHEKAYWHNDTEIVYWWYDENEYYPAFQNEKKQNRQQLNIPEDTFVLMTAGGCSNIKRHNDIIEATKIILKEIPNFLFVHLGRGRLEEKEKQLAKELNVEDNVWFCGNQSDFRKFLLVADVFTMTSTKEGLSNATIDALACGIPAVLYHVSGLWDYNIDGDNTLQIKESPRDLAEAVISLYKDEKLRLSYSEKGKELVSRKYKSSNNIVTLIDTFYQ